LKQLFVILLLALGLNTGTAQDRNKNLLLDQRLSDAIGNHPAGQQLTVSRYVPMFAFRGLGGWSSPQSRILIDGIPFDGFPLNRVSPDFVPIDLVTTEGLQVIPGPAVLSGASLPGGGINIRRSALPDSFHVIVRAFGGAETGDPVLQKHTKGNLDLYNKNKIGYSGATAISDRSGSFAYRLTAGVFGYFTAGYAGRDAILLAYGGRSLLGRQNRNYLGSLELEYESEGGTLISFQGGINGLVGWEQMPFLPLLGFFEGHVNTLRVSARNLPRGFSLHARRDGTSLAMKPQLGTEGGEFSQAVYAVHPVWSGTLTDQLRLTAAAEFDRALVSNPFRANAQFFSNDLAASSSAFSLGIEYQASRNITVIGTGRFDWNLERWKEFSGEASLKVRPAEGQEATVSVSSVPLFPNLLELHGSFVTVRDRISLARQDTFRVQGNPELVPGRSNSLSARYEIRIAEKQLSLEGFFVGEERPIERTVSNALRTLWPGDYLFSGRYTNAPARTLWGLAFSGKAAVTDHLFLAVQYQFVESRTVCRVPRHSVWMVQEVSLVQGTSFSFLMRGAGKTVWKEFAVAPKNDESGGGGTDGTVPEYWSLDLRVEQQFGDVWFGRKISASLEIQNLFNRRVQVIPIGISFDTAVIGYVSFLL